MNEPIGKVLCVILHYGAEDDTNKCIQSLIHVAGLDLVIADNDPRQSYQPPEHLRGVVQLVRTGGRAGFSEGNNIGVRAFLRDSHDSILLLNNDTIVRDGAIDYLRETLFSAGVGAVGPCMPYANAPTKIWACGGYINKRNLAIGSVHTRLAYPYEVDYLPGAAIFCRSEIWEDIGGLNEDYFLGYEEAEFALEVKKRGFMVMVDPRSVVLHKVGMSSQLNPEYFYNMIRNKLIFSTYIYGKVAGLAYGVVVTLSSVRARSKLGRRQRIRLWARAVSDQIKGVSVDRRVLNCVARACKRVS